MLESALADQAGQNTDLGMELILLVHFQFVNFELSIRVCDFIDAVQRSFRFHILAMLDNSILPKVSVDESRSFRALLSEAVYVSKEKDKDDERKGKIYHAAFAANRITARSSICAAIRLFLGKSTRCVELRRFSQSLAKMRC